MDHTVRNPFAFDTSSLKSSTIFPLSASDPDRVFASRLSDILSVNTLPNDLFLLPVQDAPSAAVIYKKTQNNKLMFSFLILNGNYTDSPL